MVSPQSSITKLTVLTTGGTIEKIYDELEGTLSNRETIIKAKILQKLRLPYTDIQVKSLMAKDSLHMTDEDRELISLEILSAQKRHYPIVVLHGTDTLQLTVKYCLKKNPQPLVPIVFTGAMKPMGFDDSDAPQNVIEALFASKLLSPGIYMTFHGQLYQQDKFRKNKELKTFEYWDEVP
jgi:L-asparaginase